MTATRLCHFVVTRFNCKFGPGRKSYPGFDANSPEWLDGRFALFERFCLPTVLSQTTTNFRWLVYFDVETPEPYLDRARALLGHHPHIVIRICESFSIELLKEDIRRAVPPSCPWLLTTRFDNDDGMRSDFVERLQSEVRADRTEALNFPIGLVLGRGRIYRSKQPSNAFVSFSEPYGADFTTVHSGNHNTMATRVPVRDIGNGEPAWLQVIHGANVSNKLRGHRIAFSAAAPGFPPLEQSEEAHAAESVFLIGLENAFVSSAWGVRDSALRAYHSLRRQLRGDRKI